MYALPRNSWETYNKKTRQYAGINAEKASLKISSGSPLIRAQQLEQEDSRLLCRRGRFICHKNVNGFSKTCLRLTMPINESGAQR